MTPKMDERGRSFAALRYVIWCCINLRPEQMRFDDGFQLFVGALAPEYVHTTIAKETFNSVLGTVYDRVKKKSWTTCVLSVRSASPWDIRELSLATI